uniref:Uncharacterized protein n=1 Tax=Ananas comosus var. bracteatus TaxID=296719 RepID=A0A6V7PTF5_ANACO|nr:unnamed protein product [Ananas comosus var. bracteatus]
MGGAPPSSPSPTPSSPASPTPAPRAATSPAPPAPAPSPTELSLLGVGRGAWSLGWDFLWNHAFRGGDGGAEASRTASRVLAALSEASRIKSTAEMRRWVLRNYPDLVALSNSFIQTLLRTFSRSVRPLREAVLVLQREVEEGELLKDCLEVGARDLEGLLRIAKDLFFSYSSSSFDSDDL